MTEMSGAVASGVEVEPEPANELLQEIERDTSPPADTSKAHGALATPSKPRDEDLVQDFRARLYDGTQFEPVDGLRHFRRAVSYQARDLVNAHGVIAQKRYERGAQF